MVIAHSLGHVDVTGFESASMRVHSVVSTDINFGLSRVQTSILLLTPSDNGKISSVINEHFADRCSQYLRLHGSMLMTLLYDFII